MPFPILLSDPVARRHPLNRGRAAWWLTLPGRAGGRHLFDLVRSNHGTLANFTAAAWAGTTRPGGWGQVTQSGGAAGTGSVRNDAVTPLGFRTDQAHTAAAWFRLGDLTASTQTIAGYSDGSLGTVLAVRSGQVGAYDESAADPLVHTTAPAAGGWHRLMYTYNGISLSTLYLDGVPVASGAPSVNAGAIGRITLLENPNTNYPERFSGGGGAVDDLALWNRRLSDAEAKADYDLSRLGYPGVLNRLDLARTVTPPAAAPPPPTNYPASLLLGL